MKNSNSLLKGEWRSMKRILSCLAVCVLLLVLYPAMPTQAEESAVQTVEVGIPVEEHPELFLTRSMPTHGEGKIAVFLIEFPDYPNDNPFATQEYYDKLYFRGFNGLQYVAGYDSVVNFYAKQSYGKLNLSGQVFDWYTAKHERSYYDNRKAELVMEAAEYYRSQGVDFSQFDGDGDGVIDSIVYHFAGKHSGTDQNDPWYSGVRYSIGGKIGDMAFTTIIQALEDARANRMIPFSTICHELMHNLGMPDLYSNAYDFTSAAYDLMGEPSYVINPYFKLMLGWIDTVQVITRDVEDIQLDIFEDSGEFAIVTDEFNGFFDEYYVVAYRDDYSQRQAVIWHIDARLNEKGTSFAYQNLMYNPRPDKSTHNSVSNPALYLFIEEISADPDVDYVLKHPLSSGQTSFVQGSALGPNNMPCSDTHDGEYTGILIDDFKEHDETYLTFDVSFVEDTVPPTIVTEERDLEFTETIKLKFNEHIYAGDNWNGFRVTDLDGNLLETSILLPHYPCNEMEITFKTDAYKDGYRLVFPEGTVRDSSGNALAAVTWTASKEHYLFPESWAQLPGVGELIRNNSGVHFFPQEESLVVITGLWENHVMDAKIEFMQLDYNGNVLKQTIVDNPFENSAIVYVNETGDGCYIFICRVEGASPYYDLLFCIDQNGELKWSNDEYHNTGTSFYGYTGYQSLPQDNGVIITVSIHYEVGHPVFTIVFISSETGEVREATMGPYENSQFFFNTFFDLSNGTILFEQRTTIEGVEGTLLQIIDTVTHEIKAEGLLKGTATGRYYVEKVYANDDGTILLHGLCFSNNENRMFLLDAELNVVRSVRLTKASSAGGDGCFWIENDGFCEIYRDSLEHHGNEKDHIRRYDRYLNLLWESDVESNFVYYFKSPTGDIMAYRSMFDVDEEHRQCYIDTYGSENAFRVAHVHELERVATVLATCQSKGRMSHWKCTDCGCYYSDQGQTLITDMDTLTLPRTEHSEETIPEVVPTCTQTGLSEGTKCATCGKVLKAQKTIPATGHHWKTATCETAKTCEVCGKTEGRALGHNMGQWTEVKAPTEKETGLSERACARCGKTEQKVLDKLEPVHTEPPTEPTEPPTEPIEPPTEPTEPPAVESQPTQPATKPSKDPTTDTTATVPQDKDEQGGAPNMVLPVILAAIGGAVVASAIALLIMKKKK